jgi:hypothetical protein
MPRLLLLLLCACAVPQHSPQTLGTRPVITHCCCICSRRFRPLPILLLLLLLSAV